MSPLGFSGEGQTLRRERVTVTKMRTWRILPRIGTGPDDRWTVLGTPIPAHSNPASDYEDGQYPTIASARRALAQCIALDNGSHERND